MTETCPLNESEVSKYNVNTQFFQDLHNYYKNKLENTGETKESRAQIGNRTLTKNRQYQIANDLYLRDEAHVQKLQITLIYLLICIAILVLIFITILPEKLGYVLLGLIICAYILNSF